MKTFYSNNLSICITVINFACSFLFILKYKTSDNNIVKFYLGMSNRATILIMTFSKLAK